MSQCANEPIYHWRRRDGGENIEGQRYSGEDFSVWSARCQIVESLAANNSRICDWTPGHCSSTGVGANTEEADAAESTDDFIHKMKIALKEAQESRFWLRTIIESELLVDDEVKALRQESDELVRIINAIIKNTQRQ